MGNPQVCQTAGLGLIESTKNRDGTDWCCVVCSIDYIGLYSDRICYTADSRFVRTKDPDRCDGRNDFEDSHGHTTVSDPVFLWFGRNVGRKGSTLSGSMQQEKGVVCKL